MIEKMNSLQNKLLIVVLILLGFALRLLVAIRGHNYDFNSFLIVVNIIDKGLNVYANTTRYNYGPVWFNLLHFLFVFASKNLDVFRYLLVIFLTLVDVIVFIILFRKYGVVVAGTFFVNPILIIITGYHNQFDNLAILFGMISVLLIGDDFEKPIRGQKTVGLLFLGLSLMTKHLLFVFPFWLAIKQKGLIQKAKTILIPILVFLLSFLPYWNDGKHGIVQNVFLYSSWNNEYFFKLIVPIAVQIFFTSKGVWLFLLLGFAVVFRQKNSFESLLLYTCVLVGTSPAITNQYLAIVVPFISAYMNPFFLLYTLLGAWHLVVDVDGLHLFVGQNHIDKNIYYSTLIVLLCLGFSYRFLRSQLRLIFQRILCEIKTQLKQ